MARKVACPICGKESEWSTDNAWRPFCSQRCKQIDLGAWAGDEYRVPGRSDDDRVDPNADRESS